MSFLSTAENNLNVLINKENMSSGKLPTLQGLVKTMLLVVTLGIPYLTVQCLFSVTHRQQLADR